VWWTLTSANLLLSIFTLCLYPIYSTLIIQQLLQGSVILKNTRDGVSSCCPCIWAIFSDTNTRRSIITLLNYDLIKCSIPFWGKLNKLAYLISHVKGIVAYFRLLQSTPNSRIQTVSITICVNGSFLLILNLCRHTLLLLDIFVAPSKHCPQA